MNKIFSVIIITIIVTLSGCTNNESLTYYKINKVKNGFYTESSRDEYINYTLLANDAVKSIMKDKKLMLKELIVTDFVDITSLENHSKLGYVLSNNIKNELINSYKVNVLEAEVSKLFKISGNGLKILSRDTTKLRSTNFDVQYAAVGTYAYTDYELIIFLKLINLETGIIEGSYAQSLPMNKGIKMLLNSK